MQIPVISNLRELSAEPRRFLFFIAFNVVSWQCLIGSVMVLLARQIDMPQSWVGFLNSFTPFTTILVVFVAPLIERWGPKPVMFTAWLTRNILMCGVFLMPVAIRYGGNRAGWYVLMGATLAFCITRAVGAGGWFPWLHEVVPEEQRGTYFSGESALTQLINVLIMAAQGLVLMGNPGVGRFLIVYAMGIAAGFVSLKWMARIPGGQGQRPGSISTDGRGTHRAALADKRFLVFVAVAALAFSATSWLASAYVLYLRDALLMQPAKVMILGAAGSLGVLVTIRFWGRFADRRGSGRAMGGALVGHSLVAGIFLLLPTGAAWTLAGLVVATVFMTIFGAAFTIAAHRAMLNYVPEEGRVGYTNLWTLGIALSPGITAILAGALIEHLGLWGFRTCFFLSGITGIVCALACLWVVRDGDPYDFSMKRLLDPALPLRTLVRIAWITAGLHESNR